MVLFIVSICMTLLGLGTTGLGIYLAIDNYRYYKRIGEENPSMDGIEVQSIALIFIIGVMGLYGCFLNWPW